MLARKLPILNSFSYATLTTSDEPIGQVSEPISVGSSYRMGGRGNSYNKQEGIRDIRIDEEKNPKKWLDPPTSGVNIRLVFNTLWG